MKTKITALIISVIIMLSLGTVTAFAADTEKIADEITANYDKALSIAGRRSFHGNCNLATAYQLQAIGIYENGLDYSGTGSSWHAYFKNVSETSGGYNIVTISGKNCLYDLVDRCGDEIYNVVYSLGTGGSSGGNHVLYIRAIIDGNVYFCDSFGTSYNHIYYAEGEGTVLPIDAFVSEYRRMNGNPYGCVYFSDGATEHLEGSASDPEFWTDVRNFETGKYITVKNINLKKSADSFSDAITVIPASSQITISETDGNWGKVEWNNKTGWVNLYLAQKISSTSSGSGISFVSLDVQKSPAYSNMIKWTANVAGNSENRYFYSFYIYRDNQKVYAGTFSTENSVCFIPDSSGVYKASVTVMDIDGDTKMHSGGTIYYNCVLTLKNDYDGDGVITENDHIVYNGIIRAMETITGKNFVCERMKKDGIMRVESENLFPEIPDEDI